LLVPLLPVEERFFRGHLNDLLLIPCALPPLLLLHRCLSLRRDDHFPTAYEVALHLFIWSVYCEAIGPLVQNTGVADPLDVLAYSVGAVASWGFWDRRNSRRRRDSAEGPQVSRISIDRS